jgi:DNA-binding PadR family transcriptional regulator
LPIYAPSILALADRDRHGLAVVQHIDEFWRGRLSPGSGTLCGAIKRLLDAGLIRAGHGADAARRRPAAPA